MDYVRITWGDKIGLYPLTSSYTDEPYMRVSDSYLPLTTNTSNLIGETQPKIVMNGWTYRPLRLVSSSSSTTFLTTSSTTDHMQEITALTETQTTNTIYHTCSSTSSTEYLTRESTSRVEYGTKVVGSQRYIRAIDNFQKTYGTQSQIRFSKTELFSMPNSNQFIQLIATESKTSADVFSARLNLRQSNGGEPVCTVYHTIKTSYAYTNSKSTSKNTTQSSSWSDTFSTANGQNFYASVLKFKGLGSTVAMSRVTGPYVSWDPFNYTSLTKLISCFNAMQNVPGTGYIDWLIKTSYTSGSASLTIMCNTGTVQTTGTTYYTCESTSSTIYHTRSSTSSIEYETGSVTTAYSGIYYTSVSANDGWI